MVLLHLGVDFGSLHLQGANTHRCSSLCRLWMHRYILRVHCIWQLRDILDPRARFSVWECILHILKFETKHHRNGYVLRTDIWSNANYLKKNFLHEGGKCHAVCQSSRVMLIGYAWPVMSDCYPIDNNCSSLLDEAVNIGFWHKICQQKQWTVWRAHFWQLDKQKSVRTLPSSKEAANGFKVSLWADRHSGVQDSQEGCWLFAEVGEVGKYFTGWCQNLLLPCLE